MMLRFHQMSDPASSVVRSSWNLEERFVAHVSAIWTMRSDLEFRTVIREKEEKREKRRFFSSCPDFIKGPIPLCPWSDRAEIWRRGSQLINLQFERWRSDLEFWKVIFLVLVGFSLRTVLIDPLGPHSGMRLQTPCQVRVSGAQCRELLVCLFSC